MNVQGHQLFRHDAMPDPLGHELRDINYWWEELTPAERTDLLERADFMVDRGYVFLERDETIMDLALKLLGRRIAEEFRKKWTELLREEQDLLWKVYRA